MFLKENEWRHSPSTSPCGSNAHALRFRRLQKVCSVSSPLFPYFNLTKAVCEVESPFCEVEINICEVEINLCEVEEICRIVCISKLLDICRVIKDLSDRQIGLRIRQIRIIHFVSSLQYLPYRYESEGTFLEISLQIRRWWTWPLSCFNVVLRPSMCS
jgi:hypothetical protein